MLKIVTARRHGGVVSYLRNFNGCVIMSDQAKKAREFRELHVPGAPLILFNVWDVGSAQAVIAAGARALATSSWSVAHANGFADGEQLPLGLAIENLQRITRLTNLPVTVDLESGYGEGPDAIATCMALAIDAGAVGCNLEDSVPADGRIRSANEQALRIESARRAADAARVPFFINARTDVFLQRPPGEHGDATLTEVLERARRYKHAGADGLFAPALIDIRLIARLAATSPLPVNIMVQEETPTARELAEHGVARVSYGPLPYLGAMKALEAAARTVFSSRKLHRPSRS
jgi:2-methylisocitrate lyase-like PEP mutase family enzyme